MTSSLKLFSVYFNSSLYKTNRFQVAVRLFNNHIISDHRGRRGHDDRCSLVALSFYYPEDPSGGEFLVTHSSLNFSLVYL